MAEGVESYVRQLLDNTQYLAAKEKEVKEEERLKAIRAAGGKEGVKAYQSIQRAEQQQAKAAERSEQQRIKSAEQREKYLRDLRLRYNAEQEKAAKALAEDMEGGALGIGAKDLEEIATKGAAAAAGVAAIGAAAYGAVEVLNEGAEAILRIDDASRRLTVGRETILALAQAGERTGVSFSQVEGLLENLPERITQAARGGNEYAESFERLGVAVKNANGNTRDADSVLRDLLSSLAGLESQSVKAGLAQELLSDVGLALVQTGALDSKAALDQYLASVEGSSIITDEAVRQARNWRAALADVSKQAKSVKTAIFEAFGDDAAQVIDNVSLAVEFLRVYGFEKLQNIVEGNIGTIQILWDVLRGDASLSEAETRIRALNKELADEEQRALDSVKAFAQRRAEMRKAAVEAGDAGEATTKLAKSTKDAESAEKDRAAALKEEARWLEHVTKLQDDRRESLDKQIGALDDVATASAIAAASEEERVGLEADAARESALAVAMEARRYAETAEEKLAIERSLHAALKAISAEELANFQAIEDEKTQIANDKAKERAEATKSALEDGYSEVLGATNTFLDQLASNQSSSISALQDAIETAEEKGQTAKAKRLKNDLEAEQEGARKVFALQQSLKYADATMSYAQALMTAAALPPPADIIKGVAATTAYGLSIATISSQEPPTFTDTPQGGYRFSGDNNTIRGAANDTAILFRDPLEGFAQAVEVMARRQAPTSTPARGGRNLLGKAMATTPVPRLLMRDVQRTTRGRI